MTSLVARALTTMVEKHGDQVDRAGSPFVGHPARVVAYLAASGFWGDEVLAAAALHDVVEDTPTTLEEIRAEFGDGVAHLVDALTRRDDETYRGYVARLADSGIGAIAIKLADLRDNMDDRRIPPDAADWHAGMVARRYVPAKASLEARLALICSIRAETFGDHVVDRAVDFGPLDPGEIV